MKIFLISLLAISLLSCNRQRFGCGYFLKGHTFDLDINENTDVYRYCDSATLNIEYLGLRHYGDTVDGVFILTPFKDSLTVIRIGEKVLIDSLKSEQVSHGQFIEGYRRYIRFAGLQSGHRAILQTLNEY
jgi:hypothetical protein